MAILAIKGNKRLGMIRPDTEIEDEELRATAPLQYGWLNDQDQLCLSNHDISRIQAKFALLSSNRINFVGARITDRKKSEMR